MKLQTGLLKYPSCTSFHTSAVIPSSDYDYDWIDGAESLFKYRPGGYHTVMVGDLLHQRYRIVDKLGFGGYSTIWLARDTRIELYVAIKVCIADAPPHESKILRARLSSSTHPGRESIPTLLDEFEIHGPNGAHLCYTMAPARCNLREVSFTSDQPPFLVISVGRQVYRIFSQERENYRIMRLIYNGFNSDDRRCQLPRKASFTSPYRCPRSAIVIDNTNS